MYSHLAARRLVALNAGARPLVDMNTKDKIQIVIQEIMQDKIFLDTSANVRVAGESTEVDGPPELDLTNL